MNRNLGQTSPSRCFGECERESLQAENERYRKLVIRRYGSAHEYIAELKAENERLREALDTELVCCHIGTLEQQESPKHAVAAIARWHYDLGVSKVLEGKDE